jgi:hypothetical protein
MKVAVCQSFPPAFACAAVVLLSITILASGRPAASPSSSPAAQHPAPTVQRSRPASAAPPATTADPSTSTPVELAQADSLALTTTAAVVALFKNEGDAVWPGYDLSQRPFLVYLPDRWAVLVNAPHPVEDFSYYPEDWPRLGAPALVHRGPYEKLAGQLEFNFEIDGLKTVAVAPTRGLEAGRRAAIGFGFTFIVHEAFHQFQRDAFRSIANDQPEEEYPILDGENTALASLEMLILMDAIRAVAQAETTLARRLTAEFLAVRRERWNRRAEDIPLFERPQELMEGSAQYTEVRNTGLMGDLCAGSKAATLSPPGYDVFAGVTWDSYLLSDFEDRIGGGMIDIPDMARNRIYPVGATLGLLLDFFHIDWKPTVSDAASSPGLAELLERGACWDLAPGDTLLAGVKKRYGYEELRARCEERARAYPVEYQAGVESLEAEPGYHLSVETRISGMSRSRSCEGGRLVLENPTRSFSKKCHVYTLKPVAKDDLYVEIRESAIVEETSPDGTTRRVDFVTPDIETAELDGRPVDLGTGGSYSFKRLKLAGSSFEILYNGEGTLAADVGRLSIQLHPPAESAAPR